VEVPLSETTAYGIIDVGGGTLGKGATKVLRTVEKPKPEAVTCTSGGFPRNLARLNNVDKACLDDVASKLRQDPRSRVVIVGHADSSERYPEVIGRKRAEAVKAYLVKERGSTRAASPLRARRLHAGSTPARRPPAPRTGAWTSPVPEGNLAGGRRQGTWSILS
jgi:hypothetical protein